MLQELFAIAQDLNRHFPDGNEPYQIMTRLLEECGELAQQVHHFERKAPELQKYGEPNSAKMAKEVKDVIRAALQIALYYGIEKQVEETFAQSYQATKKRELSADVGKETTKKKELVVIADAEWLPKTNGATHTPTTARARLFGMSTG